MTGWSNISQKSTGKMGLSNSQDVQEIVLSQISYSLVVILELSGVLEVQYKEIMMSSINKNN